jgi:D-inositol-3-phosphate glycosyltransferase
MAHAVGGIPEIVANGNAGRLLPSLDPEAWAAAVSDLLDDAGERLRLARAGRDVAAARTLARTVALVEAALEEALASRGRNA